MKNLRLCFPPMDGQVNCMHSKLMLLFHPHYVRLVVPTANLVPFDWGEQGGCMENVAVGHDRIFKSSLLTLLIFRAFSLSIFRRRSMESPVGIARLLSTMTWSISYGPAHCMKISSPSWRNMTSAKLRVLRLFTPCMQVPAKDGGTKSIVLTACTQRRGPRRGLLEENGILWTRTRSDLFGTANFQAFERRLRGMSVC